MWGKLLLEEQQPKAAVADLELAHWIGPGSPSATYNVARAYALGRTEAKGLYKGSRQKTNNRARWGSVLQDGKSP